VRQSIFSGDRQNPAAGWSAVAGP